MAKGERVADGFSLPILSSNAQRNGLCAEPSDVMSGVVARDGRTLRVLVRAEQP